MTPFGMPGEPDPMDWVNGSTLFGLSSGTRIRSAMV